MAEREGLDYRHFSQVKVKPTDSDFSPCLGGFQAESDLPLEFLQFPQYAAFPTKTVSPVSVVHFPEWTLGKPPCESNTCKYISSCRQIAFAIFGNKRLQEEAQRTRHNAAVLAGRRRKPSMQDKIDLTSQTFGRWTVESYAGRDWHSNELYRCRCECCTRKAVKGNSLRGGTSRSCGCLRRELSSERSRTHGHTAPER